MDNPRGVAEKRVEILASILPVDRFRLLAWAFFDIMLGACWHVEDNNSAGLQYSLSCAEIFDKLVD